MECNYFKLKKTCNLIDKLTISEILLSIDYFFSPTKYTK